jgi:hypothetical protein
MPTNPSMASASAPAPTSPSTTDPLPITCAVVRDSGGPHIHVVQLYS